MHRHRHTYLIRVDDAVEVRVGHAVTGQLEVGLHVRLVGVGAVDGVQLVERRLKTQNKTATGVQDERRHMSCSVQHTGKKRKCREKCCWLLISMPVDIDTSIAEHNSPTTLPRQHSNRSWANLARKTNFFI